MQPRGDPVAAAAGLLLALRALAMTDNSSSRPGHPRPQHVDLLGRQQHHYPEQKSTDQDQRRGVVRAGSRTTSAGLAIGIVATYALNFLLVSKVTDVKMPWQLVAIGVAALWVNGLIATLPPALRATRVQPSIATRSV